MSDAAPLLSIQHLTKQFRLRTPLFQPAVYKKVVDDVSFDVPRGQTLALVGESGSGKSTIGLMLLDLLEPTSGTILYDGRPFSARRGRERRALRRDLQVVFQDPYASLNARINVREALTEGMKVHHIGANAREREARAIALLQQVNLAPDALERYPHEFSGGQRQRIAIARALSVEPKFMVLDEPTSALDVSVQSQVLNLLRHLQRDAGLTYLCITHNLDVVGYLADSVCVLEAGKIVERGTVDEIFDSPKEAYTQRLLNAIPSRDPAMQALLAQSRPRV